MFKKENLTPKNIAFGAVILILLIFLGKVFDIVMLFFTAYILAASLNPIIGKLQKYMPRLAATLIVLLTTLALIIGGLFPLVVMSINKIAFAIHNLPHYIDNLILLSNTKFSFISTNKLININALNAHMSEFGSALVDQTITITKSVVSGITIVLLIGIVVFYLTCDEKHLQKSFLAIFPPKMKKRAKEISSIVNERVGGFVIAQVIASGFVGILTTIGLALIGHDHALFLGFTTALLDIIPVVGPTIAVVIGVVTIGDFSAWGYMLLTAAIYIVAQWLQNQVLRPLIFAKFMDMHPLMIIFSILIGAKFYGAWGAIIAPAVASVIMVLFDELYIKPIGKEEIE